MKNSVLKKKVKSSGKKEGILFTIICTTHGSTNYSKQKYPLFCLMISVVVAIIVIVIVIFVIVVVIIVVVGIIVVVVVVIVVIVVIDH